jgi:tetratricopeptide (TPR) repeat protein
MEQVLARGDTLPGAVRGLALLTTGIVVYAQGKNAAAAPFVDESIALLRAVDDLNLLAHALTMRGYASLGTGEHTLMAESFEQALAMHRQLDDRWGEGVTLNGRGYAALFEGHPDEAWRLLTEAETALRDADSPADLAANRNMLAMIAYRRGEYALIETLLRESLAILGVLRDTWTMAYTLTWLAGVAAMRRQGERAAKLFGAAEVLREAAGSMIQFSPNRVLYEQQVATVRAQLGEAPLAACWAEGRAMTLDQAIAYALEETGEPRPIRTDT